MEDKMKKIFISQRVSGMDSLLNKLKTVEI